MRDERTWAYEISGYTNRNVASSQSINKKIYYSQESLATTNFMSDDRYYNPVSQSMNVFGNIVGKIVKIQNPFIRKQVICFVNEFTRVLEKLQNSSNYFPPFIMGEDEDSVFLEWVFKDFRAGFTFCENEDESMWFVVSNRNLSELSLSGDLKMTDYYRAIIMAVSFAVENT